MSDEEDQTLFGFGDTKDGPSKRSEELAKIVRKQQLAFETLSKEMKYKELSGGKISLDTLLKVVGLSTTIITIVGALLWTLFLEARVEIIVKKSTEPIIESVKDIKKDITVINANQTTLKENQIKLNYRIGSKETGKYLKSNPDD